MENLKIFENEDFGQVRTITKENGEPWFVGKDVAEILEYQNGSRDINRHVEEDDREDISIHDGTQNRNMTIINESGLYSLILSSKMPKAKDFKHWVTSEVLPAIRKDGGYMMAVPGESDEDLLARAVLVAQRSIERLELNVKQRDQIIGELQPKADYTDKILKNKGLVTVSSIAKDYGMSGTAFNKLLHELHIQYKQGTQWLLYADIQDKGYTHSETVEFTRKNGNKDVSMTTKWTQKGRLFLYNTLKEAGVVPVIERD